MEGSDSQATSDVNNPPAVPTHYTTPPSSSSASPALSPSDSASPTDTPPRDFDPTQVGLTHTRARTGAVRKDATKEWVGGDRRTWSPMPWFEGGWNAGHFAFDSVGETSHRAQGSLDLSRTSSQLSGASIGGGTEGGREKEARGGIASSKSSSVLTPTATPFVFDPHPDPAPESYAVTPTPPPRRLPPTMTPIRTFTPPLRRNASFGSLVDSLPPSPSPTHLHRDIGGTTGWSFDVQGSLMSGDGGGRDRGRHSGWEDDHEVEELTLSGRPSEGLDRYGNDGRSYGGSQRTEGGGGRMMRGGGSGLGIDVARSLRRTLSDDATRRPSLYTSPPASYQDSYRHARGPSYPTPPTPTEQLQSYFSPTPDPNLFTFAAPTPASPSTYFTDPADLLYTTARQSFVSRSLSSLPASSHFTTTTTARDALMNHFDEAMSSGSPLASLYGISVELAAELERGGMDSGVCDDVLRLVRSKRAEGGASTGEGPSSNNRKFGLYKTELCRSWEEKGSCRYGTRCQFAHGSHEIKEIVRHPKFKSEVCRTFWLHGSCPYGRRCCFIHTTVPGGHPIGPPPESFAASLNGISAPSSYNDLTDDGRQTSRFARVTNNVPYSSSYPPSSSRTSTQGSGSRSGSGSGGGSASGSLGPSLSNYLAPTPPYNPSPYAEQQRFPSSDSCPPQRPGEGFANDKFDLPRTLGLKTPGRFTNNPAEVPATYQDPPLSRLRRLAGNSAPAPSHYSRPPPPPSMHHDSPSRTFPPSQPLSRQTSTSSSLSSLSSLSCFLPLQTTFPGHPGGLSRVHSDSSLSSIGVEGSHLWKAGGGWIGSGGGEELETVGGASEERAWDSTSSHQK